MGNKEFLLELVKIFRGNLRTKAVLILLTGGIGIISQPFWQTVINAFPTRYNLEIPNIPIDIGWVLIVTGITLTLLFVYLDERRKLPASTEKLDKLNEVLNSGGKFSPLQAEQLFKDAMGFRASYEEIQFISSITEQLEFVRMLKVARDWVFFDRIGRRYLFTLEHIGINRYLLFRVATYNIIFFGGVFSMYTFISASIDDKPSGIYLLVSNIFFIAEYMERRNLNSLRTARDFISRF